MRIAPHHPVRVPPVIWRKTMRELKIQEMNKVSGGNCDAVVSTRNGDQLVELTSRPCPRRFDASPSTLFAVPDVANTVGEINALVPGAAGAAQDGFTEDDLEEMREMLENDDLAPGERENLEDILAQDEFNNQIFNCATFFAIMPFDPISNNIGYACLATNGSFR